MRDRRGGMSVMIQRLCKYLSYVIIGLLVALPIVAQADAPVAPADDDPVIEHLELEDATVAEACEMLFQNTNVQYYIASEVRNKRIGRLVLTGKRLTKVLDYLLKPVGLYWWKDENGVFIISDKPPQIEAPQQPPKETQSLQQPTSKEVQEEPIAVEGPAIISEEEEPSPVLPRLVSPEELQARVAEESKRYTFALIRLKWSDAAQIAYMLGFPVNVFTPQMLLQAYAANPLGMAGIYPPKPVLQMLQRYGILNTLQIPGLNLPQRNAGGSGFGGVEGITTRGDILQQFGGIGGGIAPGGIGAGIGGALPGGIGGALGAGAPGAAGAFQIEGLQNVFVISTVNALIVYGTPEAIQQLRQLIDLIDIPPDQIEIESQFVALQRNAQSALGINWAVGGENVVVATSGMPGGTQFTIGFVRGNLRATLGVLLSRGEGKVLRAPRVVTTNNQPAFIMFSTVQPVFYDMLQVDQFGNPIRITLPIPVPIPVGLMVLPRVNADMSVSVFVAPIISEITGYVTSPIGGSVPIFTMAQTTAYLTVRDGESFAIGGLSRGSHSTAITEVPLLARLPIIGELFKGKQKQRSEDEMIIFVTPHVIRLWPEIYEELFGAGAGAVAVPAPGAGGG